MKLDRFYPIFDHPDWLKRMLPLGVKLALACERLGVCLVSGHVPPTTSLPPLEKHAL